MLNAVPPSSFAASRRQICTYAPRCTYLLASALGSHVVPRLVDTSIRVLGQEPLAGALPTSVLLELAEILDRAGFEYLEVSGGGVFDAAVRGGVESPWERIRALRAHTKTPLALALRGRFLVGSRPVSGDL